MRHVLRVLIRTSILGILTTVLCFASGCISDPPDYQENAPVLGEYVHAKPCITYLVRCDLGNGYYLVTVSTGGAFGSTPMKLHRRELSKFRRVY